MKHTLAQSALLGLAALALSPTAACDRQGDVPPAPPDSGSVEARAQNGEATRDAGPDPSRLPELDPTRLPEDEEAGKRAQAQWREHLAEEEHERQLGFDGRRLKEHRAVVRLFSAARASCDRARSEKAVAIARASMRARMADIRRRVTQIDHWGVNSRLLSDYEALAAALEGPYGEAKVAALRGEPHALEELQRDFDRRMAKIADWLAEAASEEGEGGERERAE